MCTEHSFLLQLEVNSKSSFVGRLGWGGEILKRPGHRVRTTHLTGVEKGKCHKMAYRSAMGQQLSGQWQLKSKWMLVIIRKTTEIASLLVLRSTATHFSHTAHSARVTHCKEWHNTHCRTASKTSMTYTRIDIGNENWVGRECVVGSMQLWKVQSV